MENNFPMKWMLRQPIHQRLAQIAITHLHPATATTTTVVACSSPCLNSWSSIRLRPPPPDSRRAALSRASAVNVRGRPAQQHGPFSFWRAMKQEGGGRPMEEEEERRGGAGQQQKPRVVIIGAGMAGIAAAQRLQKQAGVGWYDLTILEASDRIGGRICSSEFYGEGIELGATWIHGIEGNPVYKMAMQIGAMQNTERAWEGKDGFLDNALVKAEGGLDVAREVVEPVEELYKQLLQEVQEMGVLQPPEMVAGTAAIDVAPVKIPVLPDDCNSVGAFLRHGLDRFRAQQPQSNHHPGSGVSTNAIRGKEEEEEEEDEILGSPRWSTRSLQEGCFKMHENLERGITAADDLYDIDLVGYSEYLEFPGEHKTIGKGYSSLVRALASSLPSGVVQLGRKVEKIVWSGSSPYPGAPVTIHCVGGSVVEADHVIITVSLGVLKAETVGSLERNVKTSDANKNAGNPAFPSRTLAAEVERKMQLGEESFDNDDKETAAELFDPPLPMWKLDSISRLGFGVVDKVFVHIEPAKEGGQHRSLKFIFDPTARGEQQHSDVPAWMRKTFSLYPIHKESHALLAWFTGREALQVESLTDDEILSGISKTLSGFGISESQQGTFVGCRRSQWGLNSLFRGSYSYVKVGSTGEDIDVLAEPLPKLGDGGAAPLQILFAGEATHRHYYSTTHGAYFSGLREAERLLQHYGLLVQS